MQGVADALSSIALSLSASENHDFNTPQRRTHAIKMVAANAHCTIAQREASDIRTKLENHKRKREQGSTKVKSRFVTHLELKESFEEEKRQRVEKKKAE